ncbi:ATP-binding cassette, subfamily G (WHITE), member 1 [Nematocida major]|uniref:ATP-binding cassette, subfamily G (WHITE), member 1 n=1 Tax=Nematocida major TaxID=1912982 RepID=UPI002007CD24|nr:ATP-binding cassette, subfamily G (WHITE), member 1 [Nematocida major]KAH9385982.1 ATP-binding cassette, subfamily G (WHITE), member 1 [Nematocida major]
MPNENRLATKENQSGVSNANVQPTREDNKMDVKPEYAQAQEGTLVLVKDYEIETASGISLLKRASLSIPEGKLTALIGLSGDGKSTLMNGLAGHCTPSHKTYGEIWTKSQSGGLEKRNVKEWFPTVNYSQQDVVSYENIPLREGLCSVARCEGRSIEDVDGYMDLFRLSKSAKTRFVKLSGGEQKRAMVIIGLLSNKQFNIWDEPLSGLDSEIARVILSTMANTQTTNLVTVHQVSEDLMKKFDNTVIMHRSTIVYSGPTREIKAYFTSAGVEFPDDTFYINYIMKLSAENSENEVDKKNIAALNRIADAILQRPQGAPAAGNLVHNKDMLKVSWVNIRELFRWLSYFDRWFRGSSLIADFLVPGVFIGFMGVIIQVIEYNNRQFSLFGNTNITMRFFVEIKKYFSSIEIANKEAHINAINRVLTIMGHGAMLDRIVFMFSRVLNFYTLLIIFVSSNFKTQKFQRLCKTNTYEGRIKPADYITALFFDVFVRKGAIIWLMNMLVFWSMCFVVDAPLKPYITVGWALPTALLLGYSGILGLHAVLLNLIPVSIKFFPIVAAVYLIVIGHLPLAAEVAALERTGFYMKDLPILASYKIPDYLGDLSSASDSPSLLAKSMAWLSTAKTVVMQYLVLMSPGQYVSQILTKILLYRNKLTLSSGKEVDAVSNVRMLVESHSESLIAHIEKSSAQCLDIDTAVQYLDLIAKKKPSMCEVLSPESKLKSISLIHIAWSMLRFWCLPMCLMCASAYFAYRSMQPKLRS